jgi:hypothetical protein
MTRKRRLCIALGVLLLPVAGIAYWLQHRLPFNIGAVDRIEVIYGGGQRVTVTHREKIGRILSLMKYSSPCGVHAGGLEGIKLRVFSGGKEQQHIWVGDYNEWGFDGEVKGFSDGLDSLLRELFQPSEHD